MVEQYTFIRAHQKNFAANIGSKVVGFIRQALAVGKSAQLQ
jgi:hypothetical protein